MSDNLEQEQQLLWLIGTGSMAIAYAKVLIALNVRFRVIGRGQASADEFFKQTGMIAEVGGLDNVLIQLRSDELPDLAIVAVNVDSLAKVTMQLLARDVKAILVEKPVGLNRMEVAMVAKAAKDKMAEVYAGYNRRFFSSVLAAKDLIEEDGGVLSFSFEFTEWSHVIEKLPTPLTIKKEWFMANSTHVIDLAFYLGGVPQELCSYKAGGLDWHPTASIFSGAGITTLGALFSYQANWEGPGRWGVEMVTKARRYIFRPLEKLHIQQSSSVIIENYSIDDSLDTQYKPGLYRQVEAFISSKRSTSPLLTIEEHEIHCEKIYERIHNKSINLMQRGEIDNES